MIERKKIILSANKKLILENHESFWMVISGEVDIYYVNVSINGAYSSQLNHLYRAGKGELVFSLLTRPLKSGMKLLVVSAGAKLLELNRNELLNVDHTFLKFYINKWILKLADKLYRENIPRIYKALDENKDLTLGEGEVSYPTKGLFWCSIREGEISKYANSVSQGANTQHSYPFPVSNKLYIKALSCKVNVEVLDTKEVLQDEILFMLGLNDIQNHFYKRILKNHEEVKRQEKERIISKIQTDGEKLNATLQELGGIVSNNFSKKNGTLVSSKVLDKNPILAACRQIGETVGFDFVAPKFMESYDNSMTNQLFAIGQASNVRIRKIILRGTWWKEENGHILAFTKEDKKPIALIQRDATSYVYLDSETNKEVLVNNDLAESLQPIAYMFFFAFDSRMTSVKKVMNFAIQGVKKDARYLIIAALGGSLLGLLVPILSGVMFDDVIPTADRDMLFEVFGIMLMIGIVTALLQLVQGVLQLRVETKSNINLQGGLMDHLLRLPVSFYKKYTAGDLTNRALSINAIRQILSNTVLTAVLSGTFSIVNLGLLFYYDSSLAWIGVGLALTAVVFIAAVGWLKLRYDREMSDEQGEIQGFLFEFLSGITKIRITGAEKRIFTLWATKFSKLKRLAFRSGSYQNYIEVFNGSYPLLTNIFFFSFIYYMFTTSTIASTGLISVGAFMAFISAFNQFLNDSLKMSMSLISSLNVVTLYERVKPILEEIPESSQQSADPGELSGDIELNSVSFRYNQEQPLVLKDVSLKIKAGEMVAFIGPSGSGKSTVMRILLGFEEPELGSVYYDGNSFESMNKDLVRRQIGVVLQNGSLMSGSIYKNIVGNSELTLDDAWDAAKMAGMEEDIKQMPMEMHTMVSEGAGTFSGGQRQRLMIARAIAHKPRLLFMDEATSALDNRTQNIVSESLDNLQATRIVIAHRLSTIINADRIYVMDKGSIVETGTYNELIQKDGLFSKLAKRQIA
ncbi:NHLP bacteriocin export ABC transporter permease/ATPase subunit [Zobellia sp. B3R18]|uniref:NHLP bacteriocin export ABC transporter permease/ATPase subunit n=1 Tax=Zobellia sp. B3R18 TaxID=2841568 RepID=UPI001C074D68|nr:NHLP bacteriocin export ABC transporter permease/ATPase subunit [Zobellia sp. B3R18]MBU2974985.1 NHLP bacteriocin export ABC transporter permease/ATPase subunit [Zobellia sp. B3R18]